MGQLRKVLRNVIIPWGGNGFKYCHLVASSTGVGNGVHLVDIWARSVSRLAVHADLSAFNGLAAGAISDKRRKKARIEASPLFADQVRVAAGELVGFHMSGPGAPAFFDSSYFDGDDAQRRRGVMYRRLLTAAYRREQDKDIGEKLVARGCQIHPESVQWVRRHFAALPAKATTLRAHLFRALTNSVYSERRYLPVLQPDDKLRAAMPRTPCFLCGMHDDGTEHVYGACAVLRWPGCSSPQSPGWT